MDKVYFKYVEDDILENINFCADSGEAIAILGPTGSGKTTFLLIAAGLLEPYSGEIYYKDIPLKKQLPEVRREIGLVFQDPDDQIFNSTVYEEIAFTLKQLYPKEIVETRILEVAKIFNIENILFSTPYKLSVGQKRLVTFASIYAYWPKLLLLDEPTANLSSKIIRQIVNIILEYKSKGNCIILTSHDINFVVNIADKVYALNNKKMVGGKATQIMLKDQKFLEIADISTTNMA
ncbi:MAG: ABC transporter ATP-binding protein [Nitrososphaeria archaeon]